MYLGFKYTCLKKQQMKNLIFIFLFLLIQCKIDGPSEEPSFEVTNEIVMNIDGKQYKIYNEEVNGNINCNHIFVSSNYKKDNSEFSFNILLNKKGAILDSEFWDKNTNVYQHYLTPNFNSASTFIITNFVYNEAKNEVSFSFQATLFMEEQITKTKIISGNILVKTLKTTPCQIANLLTNYDSNNFKFNTTNYLRFSNNQNTNQTHRFFSNNGYYLDFVLENDPWYLPIGTYHFFDFSNTNLVSLSKYVGLLKADQLKLFIESDWEKYDTEGNFVIQNKFTENGFKQISGMINMQVKKDNVVIYDIQNMKFQIGTNVP